MTILGYTLISFIVFTKLILQQTRNQNRDLQFWAFDRFETSYLIYELQL